MKLRKASADRRIINHLKILVSVKKSSEKLYLLARLQLIETTNLVR